MINLILKKEETRVIVIEGLKEMNLKTSTITQELLEFDLILTDSYNQAFYIKYHTLKAAKGSFDLILEEINRQIENPDCEDKLLEIF